MAKKNTLIENEIKVTEENLLKDFHLPTFDKCDSFISVFHFVTH